jgi:hypothetical protein
MVLRKKYQENGSKDSGDYPFQTKHDSEFDPIRHGMM